MTTYQSNHLLTLEIPEPIYASLVRTAEKTGQRPEDLAVHWLAAAAEQYIDDPLEKFIGAFSSPIPDWVDHHDVYLGQALLTPADPSELG